MVAAANARSIAEHRDRSSYNHRDVIMPTAACCQVRCRPADTHRAWRQAERSCAVARRQSARS